MSIFNFFKTDSNSKFSALDAYTTTSVNKATSLEELYENSLNNILSEIKSACKSGQGRTEKYIIHETYITSKQKKELATSLEELGYRVLYNSETSMIVSWAHLRD